MTITSTVVGVRLWPHSQGSKRVVSLEWVDAGDGDFPVHHTFDVEDNIEQFDLGDVVDIQLTLAPNQARTT
jgi:hypothetical protein